MRTFTEKKTRPTKEEKSGTFSNFMNEVDQTIPEFTGLTVTKIERVESSEERARTMILGSSVAALWLPTLCITAYAMYQGDRELLIQIVERSQYGFLALLLAGLGYSLVRRKNKNAKDEDD